jgi:hypothetical protein
MKLSLLSGFANLPKHADIILIGDTGSTDDTVQLSQQHGAKVVDIRIKPWRFDKAREAVLALLPDDVDSGRTLTCFW